MDAQKQILPIGTVLKTDEEGHLISQSSVETIREPWKSLVDEIVAAYARHLGADLHSLYIRGSVARGTAIEGISDIDGLVVLNAPQESVDLSWTRTEFAPLYEKYPFCTGIDIGTASAGDILSGQKQVSALMIKINSACVYGTDLAPELPQVRPGRKAFAAVWQFGYNTTLDFESDREHGFSVPQRCRWVCKQILRAGGELVMEREQAYSRDLYPCYEMFSRHYPAYEPQMKHVLELALWPTDDRDELAEAVGAIRPLLLSELERLYPGAVSPTP